MLQLDPHEYARRIGYALEYHRVVQASLGIDPQTWLAHMETALARHSLPTALALIHRRVVPLTNEQWFNCVGPRSFPAIRRPNGLACDSLRVWGYGCPRHASSGELELDHAWPYSHGGKSAPENGVWLCKLHNRAKSDDVHFYEWPEGHWPSWLQIVLTQMKRKLTC